MNEELGIEAGRAEFEAWARSHNIQLTLDVRREDYAYAIAKASWEAWKAARPVADAGEAVAYCAPDANGIPLFGKGWMFGPVETGNATMPLYRAAPSARTLSEAQAANLDLVIARLEQIAGNFTDDYRNSAAEALVCARAIAAPSVPAEAQSVRYWMDGTKIIEACLSKAAKAEHRDAPFPLNAEQAALWHRAQKEAYHHALEMMGVPDGDALAAGKGSAEASGPRFTSERPDILHAIYKGFQRGDSVERVHFDVCALIKAAVK